MFRVDFIHWILTGNFVHVNFVKLRVERYFKICRKVIHTMAVLVIRRKSEPVRGVITEKVFMVMNV